jgi:hypothetical protein
MLKRKNHKDGFTDILDNTAPESSLFYGSTERSKKTEVSYTIRAQAREYSFSGNSYTTIPLFVGKCQNYLNGSTSCDPREWNDIEQVQAITLNTTGESSKLAWNIIAQVQGENISISGTGNISGTEKGTLRIQGERCLDNNGDTLDCSLG